MSNLKQTIKDSYQKLALVYYANEHTKNMKHLILNSSDPIPKVSSKGKKEILSYWKQYGIHLGNTLFHQFMYAKTGICDPRFVPPWVAFHIIYPYLNERMLETAWDDKAYLERRLPGFPTPKQIVVNIGGILHDGALNRITQDEAAALIRLYDRVLVKPTIDSGESKGIQFYQAPFDPKEIFSHSQKNYTVQKIVRQSKALSLLNDSSLNCIRILTLQWEGDVEVLASFVRIGGRGQVTDISEHQFGCAPVRPNGQVGPFGMSEDYSPITVNQTGTPLREIVVPNFPAVLDLVKQAHLYYPHFGIIGWDVGIDENDKPIIIEGNVRCPGAFNPQLFFGPLLGKHTESILREIDKNKYGPR